MKKLMVLMSLVVASLLGWTVSSLLGELPVLGAVVGLIIALALLLAFYEDISNAMDQKSIN